MFQFPGLPPPGLCIQPGARGVWPPRVRPFGDLRVVGRVPLAAAYRSLPRPSSASCAKASTVRPFHLRFYMLVPLLRWLGHQVAYIAIRCFSICACLFVASCKKKEFSSLRYAALRVRDGGEPPGPDAALVWDRRAGAGKELARSAQALQSVKSMRFPGKLCAP